MAKKSRQSSRAFSQNSPTTCQFDKQLARRDARQLGLSKADLPNSIKEIITTLNEAGFEAYIVGGGVRDALLGLQPKDFDAVTNATPNQIKEVFGKRCRIIGRRFLLCHVYSGRDMIEVATFRAPPKDDNHTTEDGMIMRDNVWGDIYQDVVRRDFSINALYYQPLEGFVYDFCGGLADIDARTIRLLGDTQKRIEEDPVRLLRALRFKAKLGFDFDDNLEQQFNDQNWALMSQVSPHRLYDETQKMFTGGYITALLPLLFDYQALNHLVFYPPTLTPLLEQVMLNTDKRIGQGKSINPAFFYAALLWENYLYLLEKAKKTQPFVEAQIQSAHKVMDKQRPHTAMPKFAEQFIKDIWLMQPRLAEPRKKNITKLFENPRFRAGFDFLMLREQVEAKNHAIQAQTGQAVTLDNESTNGMGHWWAWFQTLNAKQQQRAIDEFDIQAVRLRFANIIQGNGQTAFEQPSDPDSSIGNGSSSRRSRRNKGNDKQKSSLTEQEQQEKDQLQQLSLAHDNPPSEPAKPAMPLWGTPFNHQVAETDVIAPVVQMTKETAFTEVPEPVIQSQRSRNNRKTDAKKADSNARPTLSQALNQIPSTRKRRTPSSDLTVIEKHQLAENLLNTTDNETASKAIANPVQPVQIEADTTISPVLPGLSATPIPKKRTRKKVEKVDAEVDAKAVVNTEHIKNADSVSLQTDTPAHTAKTPTETPPVKRGRKPKAAVENAEVLQIKTETLPKKIPAKRTRRHAVKPEPEQAKQTQTEQEQPKQEQTQ